MSKKLILPSFLALSCLFNNVVNAGYSDFEDNPKTSNQTNVRNKAKDSNNKDASNQSNTSQTVLRIAEFVGLPTVGLAAFYFGGRGPKSELASQKKEYDLLKNSYDSVNKAKNDLDENIKKLNKDNSEKTTKLNNLNKELKDKEESLKAANQTLQDKDALINQLQQNNEENKNIIINAENKLNAEKYQLLITAIDAITSKYPQIKGVMNILKDVLENKKVPKITNKFLNDEDFGSFMAKIIELCGKLAGDDEPDYNELWKSSQDMLPEQVKPFVGFVAGIIKPIDLMKKARSALRSEKFKLVN